MELFFYFAYFDNHSSVIKTNETNLTDDRKYKCFREFYKHVRKMNKKFSLSYCFLLLFVLERLVNLPFKISYIKLK